MVIDRIELNHYRNYEHLELEPHPGINLFFGQNGSGKTNLLEAIHYCALGKSHRLTQDAHAVMAGEKAGSASISVRGKWTRNQIDIRLQPGEQAMKSVWIDHKKVKKLSEMMGVLRLVIFSPEDLDLIKEGPAVRRRFMDMMISQISRSYFIALQQYRLAMEQRNAILRNSRLQMLPIDPMIVDFEAAMAEHAAVIDRERRKYTEMISDNCREIYQEISGHPGELFQTSYHGFMRDAKDDYGKMLAESREEDLRQGLTGIGPHRDDLHLTLNRKSMKLFASQGQMRTAALSLKMSQLRILTRVCGESPVLLLDDVMSELDLNRRMNLLREIGEAQTFITFSDEGDLDQAQPHRTYRVFSEDGKAAVKEQQAGPESGAVPLREPDFT